MFTFKAVFWDMDGTLINSEEIYDEILEDICSRHTLVLPDIPVGLSLESTWSLIEQHNNQPTISKEDWTSEIISRCVKNITHSHVRPGIKPTLEAIFSKKIPQTCVSNSHRHVIEDAFHRTGLIPYFKFWIGGDEVKFPKPSPEPYLKACKLNGLTPSDCIAIEDTQVGIEAAKEAGLTAVAHPNNTTKNLDFSRADYIIHDPQDLLSILKLQ